MANTPIELMRTPEEIRAKFDEVVDQRDKCERGSAARQMLAQRAIALGWAIGHPEAPDPVLDENIRLLWDCLG